MIESIDTRRGALGQARDVVVGLDDGRRFSVEERLLYRLLLEEGRVVQGPPPAHPLNDSSDLEGF